MNNDALVPEKKKIQISDRTYEIGKLTLKQVIELARIISGALLSSKAKMKELQSKESDSNAQDIINILDLLATDDVVRIFSILLKENDLKFVENELDFNKSLEVILALCEHNKFEDVKKNFQSIIDLITPKKKDQH